MICSIRGIIEKKSRFGKPFDKYFDFLQKSQYWSIEKIDNYKLEQMKALINHVETNVPYYAEIFKKLKLTVNDFKSIEDLNKLPVLTKEDIRLNFKKLQANNISEYKTKVFHTGGSMGKALEFISPIDIVKFRWAIFNRHKARFGINTHNWYATFTGHPAIPVRQKSPPYWRFNYPMKQVVFTMHHMALDKTPAIVEKLNSTKLEYYTGYPSILDVLAKNILELGLSITNPPKMIFTGAEALLENQKEVMGEVFKCKITDTYGFSEGCGNASTCEYGNYHEDFELGILQPGEKVGLSNDILATGFKNYAMPFIRYQVGDTATFSEEKCKCGRSSNVIQQIHGRSEDYVITPEGNRIQRFDYLFKDTSGIKEAQILQKELGIIQILIVKRSDYDYETESYLKKGIEKYISKTLRVDFIYTDEIEREQNGKFRAVKSLLNK